MDRSVDAAVDSFIQQLSGSVGPLADALQMAESVSSRARELQRALGALTEVRSDTASTSLELANTSGGLMAQKRNRECSFRGLASALSKCIPSTDLAETLLNSDPWDPEFTSGCFFLAQSISALKRLDEEFGQESREDEVPGGARSASVSSGETTDSLEFGGPGSAPIVSEIREIQGDLMFFVEQKYFAYVISLCRCLVASLPFDLSSVDSSVQLQDSTLRVMQAFQESEEYLNPPRFSVKALSSAESGQPRAAASPDKGQPANVFASHSEAQYDSPKLFQVAELVTKSGTDNFLFMRHTLPAHASCFDEVYASVMSRHYQHLLSCYLKAMAASDVASPFPFPEYSCSGMDFFRGSTEQQRAGQHLDAEGPRSERPEQKRPGLPKSLSFLTGGQARAARGAKERLTQSLERPGELLFPLDLGLVERRAAGASTSPADSSLTPSPNKQSRAKAAWREKGAAAQKRQDEAAECRPALSRVYRQELDAGRLKKYSSAYLSMMGLFGSRLDSGYEARGFAPTSVLAAFYGFRWGYDRLKVVYTLEALYESCKAQGWCVFFGEAQEAEEHTQKARQAVGSLCSYPAHVGPGKRPSLNQTDHQAVAASMASKFSKPDFLNTVYSMAFVPSSKNSLPKCYLHSIYADDSLMHQLPVDYALLSALVLLFSECNAEYSVLLKIAGGRGAANTLLKQVFADTFEDTQTKIIETITGNEWLRQHIPSLALLVCGASWLRRLAEDVLGNATLGLYLGRIANGVLHILKGQVEEHVAALMSAGPIPASELELLEVGPSAASLPPSLTYPTTEMLATLCFLVEEDPGLQETVGLLVIQLFRAYCARLDAILESGGIARFFSCAKKVNSLCVFLRVLRGGFDTGSESLKWGSSQAPSGDSVGAVKAVNASSASGPLATATDAASPAARLCRGASIFTSDAMGSGRWVLSELERALGPLLQELSEGLTKEYLPSLWGEGPGSAAPHDLPALSKLLDHIEQERGELEQLRALLDGPQAILFDEESEAALEASVSGIIAERFDSLRQACREASPAGSGGEPGAEVEGTLPSASERPAPPSDLEKRVTALRNLYSL